MQFLNEFFETKPSTLAGTTSPGLKSLTTLSRPPASMHASFTTKSLGKAAFTNKVKQAPSTQSVDNLNPKALMITELPGKDHAPPYGGAISGQGSSRSPVKLRPKAIQPNGQQSMTNIMQAEKRTAKSIEVFHTIGGRREKMMEQHAARMDELLRQARTKRQKVPI